jgi:hypothetical protein
MSRHGLAQRTVSAAFDAPVSRDEVRRLALIDRRHATYPSDAFAAARHEAMVAQVEDLRHRVGPTIGLPEPDNEAVCEALVADDLSAWATIARRNIETGRAWGTKAQPVPLAIARRIRNVARVQRRPECGAQDRCRDTRSTLRKNPHDECKA